MKRIGYLYDEICSYENCKAAITAAVKGKKNRRVVKRVLNHREKYAYALSELLKKQAYQPSPYREVKIIDGPSQKARIIQVPMFWPDQCVHHALMNVLQPILMRSSYYWSCGSIPGRGSARGKRGVERATLMDKRHAKYCAKLDMRQFYKSIPHDRLKDGFRKRIKDRKTLGLIDTLIDSYPVGLPIGNYTSAWFANFYLSPMDFYIKRGVTAGGLGAKHYIRFVDDMVITGNNKKRLHAIVRAIDEYASDQLGVAVKGDWQVFLVKRDKRMRGKDNRKGGKCGRPIDFLGYCFSVGYTTMRKRNALALMRKSRKIRKRIDDNAPISYRAASGFVCRSGQLKHFWSRGLKEKYVDVIPEKLLKEVIRRESKRRLLAAGGICDRAAAGQARLRLCTAI